VRDCNRVFRDVASKLNGFVKKVVGNGGKVLQNLLNDFWTGMLSKQNVLLSEISRGTKGETSPNKKVERFSRGLTSFSCQDLVWNYHETIKPEINDRTVFVIDDSDVIKPFGTKFEDLGTVRDGSTGNIEKGYGIVNVVALSPHHKQPIPLYAYVVSNIEIDYVSNNIETEKALDCINRSFGSVGIKVFDRGYDDCKLIRRLINAQEKFIIRCKKNRDVILNNKKIDILDIVKEPASEIKSYFQKDKKSYTLTYKKYAVVISEMELNLIVITGYGKDPMFLLTNMSLDKELETTIAKVYRLRWKIEEIHLFEKEVFSLENFRVRKLKAIRNVVLLTSMLCGFIAVICEHQNHKLFKELFKMSQTLKKKFGKNHLYFYSIARAISDLFTLQIRFSSA